MKRNLLSFNFNCLAPIFFEKILFQGQLRVFGTDVEELPAREWSVTLQGSWLHQQDAFSLRLQLHLCISSLGEM